MKNTLRQSYRKKRDKLSEAEVKKNSSLIKQKLERLPEFKEAKMILMYASFKSEVHTHDIIKEFLHQKQIVLTKMDSKEKRLALFEVRDWTDLEENPVGILEPKIGREVYPQDIDLVIVPGVVFDTNGKRIGYGAGYYDRLLSEISGPKIALAFEVQIAKELPIDNYDINVDKILTEKRVLDKKL